MKHDTLDDTSARKLLWDLIKDIRFAMFTTHHSNGHLHARPMTTQNTRMDEDGSLWFFMSRAGETVADIETQPEVNAVYADPGADKYVSVSGTARVVESLAKKEQLWNKLDAAWFPGGAADPDLALVQVQITHANYWDVNSSKLVQLFALARAAMTGQPPGPLGTHGEVRMR